MAMHERGVAIVGMSVLLPGAPDLESYWRNLVEGVDAIDTVPPDRLDPTFYDPKAKRADRFYCNRGGFIDPAPTFDAASFGIMPVTVAGAEPDQMVALQVAAAAFRDAGPSAERIDRSRAAVIFGRGGYLSSGILRLAQRVQTAEQLVVSLRSLLPGITEEKLEQIKLDFQARLGPEQPEAAIGLVPSLAASRIANRLDLHGPAYTIDAACASSLVALDQAVSELESGRCDFALAGGIHHANELTMWSVFTQLRALSPTQQIRPFDRRADGLLIGEGTGVVALKRASDARRDGDRIYAIIRGTGISSDGRASSVMTPRIEGQLLALERAWSAAELDPATVGLVEAHGTATPAGDEAEIETLARFFGRANGAGRAGLGSVKSMIGHTMPAAGIAGLIKAALAIHHETLLPTLHCEEPHPRLAETRFRPIQKAEPWDANGTPRRAAVNAFGFGGINSHVVLESATRGRGRGAASRARSTDTEIVDAAADAVVWMFAADDVEGLQALLDERARGGSAGSARIGHGPMRLAIAAPDPARVEMARKVLARGRAWRGRNDIWFAPKGLLGDAEGRVAFLFPGIEPTYDPQVDDVAQHFDLPRPDFEIEDIESQGYALIQVGRLMDAALRRIGVRPDAIAGHSIGEWSGMIASEMVPPGELDGFIESLDRGVPLADVVFTALGCGADVAAEVVADLEGVTVSHDNCPHQSVICGPQAGMEIACERLRAKRVMTAQLPFRSGFHTPYMAPEIEAYLGPIHRVPLQAPSVPIWSATTCHPFPSDPGEIRELATRHYLEPVRFRELIEALYADGVRAFVQVGLGSLIGFVSDTLGKRPHLAVSSVVSQRNGLAQLGRAAAALFVEGADLDLAPLFGEPAAPRTAPKPQRLELNTRLVRLDGCEPIVQQARVGGAGARRPDHPVLSELEATLQAAGAASEEIASLWSQRRPALRRARTAQSPPAPVSAPLAPAAEPAPTSGPREGTKVLHLSLDTVPEFIDHAFYRQPEGWPDPIDRFPIAPMTAMIQMMLEAARDFVPERTVVGIEQARALRWMSVAPPIDAKVHMRYDGESRVKVSIEGYARGTVLVADDYPKPTPRELPALENPRPSPVDAEELYEIRWMFHGPRYQGVVGFGKVARNGIDGAVKVMPAQGSFLDSVGQLLGAWVLMNAEINRIGLPMVIERIEYFEPEPVCGTKVACEIRVSEFAERSLSADIALRVDGRECIRITGWTDRRFDSDPVLFSHLLFPEVNTVSEPGDRPYELVPERWPSASSRELVMRRFLGGAEREEYHTLTPNQQREWLLGRIAAKEAVRRLIWKRGHRPLFPIEVRTGRDDVGRPLVEADGVSDLRVSISHKPGMAVALATRGACVGIDIERIEPRSESFERIAFSEAERALLPPQDRDEWIARFWSAKEAAAKAAGTGLAGRPRSFPVEAADGDRLVVAGRAIESRREGDFVVSWTVDAND